jgi:prepilin-type N-terminal cleavage/methylation domain-containing protein
MKHSFRGFTLLELLVVIAIIGLLSAIVMASLGGSRNKAADASVQSNLNAARSQIELYYVNNSNSYGTAFTLGTCPSSGTTMFYADVTIRNAIAAAGAATGGGTVQCVTGSGYWIIQAPLKTSGYWCIDHRGVGRTNASALSGTPTTCP